MERVLDLTLKLADEGLSPEEQAELERLIEAEPLARRRHLQMLEVEASLRSARHTSAPALAAASSSSLIVEHRVAAVLQTINRPAPLLSWKSGRRARTAGLVIASGALAAAALVLLVRPTRPHDGKAARPAPMARMSTAPASRREGIGRDRSAWSAALMPVQVIPPADRVTFDLGDGGRLEVRGRAVLSVERAGAQPSDDRPASRVSIEEGTVAFRRPAGPSAALTTLSLPQGEVLLRGARAVLVVSSETTRLHVLDGEATFVPGVGNRMVVRASQGAVLAIGKQAAVAPLPSALFITGRTSSRVPAEYLDDAMVRRLETLGFDVDPVGERELRAEHLRNRDLVLISPSVTSIMHDRVQELGMVGASIPILCSRPMLYQDLGMTGPGRANSEFSERKRYLRIADATHPMAAGLHGGIEVLGANMSLGWGVPAPSAARVAVLRDKPERIAIFAYDRQAPMVAPVGPAAARRVGFFLHPTAARFLSEDAWRLFDAAVRWTSEDAK
jgi:hypothetical protein